MPGRLQRPECESVWQTDLSEFKASEVRGFMVCRPDVKTGERILKSSSPADRAFVEFGFEVLRCRLLFLFILDFQVSGAVSRDPNDQICMLRCNTDSRW